VGCCALSWIDSFLNEITQRVVVKGSMSSLVPCTWGVPQGSVLGPALVFLYIPIPIESPIERLMHRHGSYADDVNVYSAIHASDTHTCPAANAVQALHDWYIRNGLLPNPEKSEVMKVGTLPVQVAKR